MWDPLSIKTTSNESLYGFVEFWWPNLMKQHILFACTGFYKNPRNPIGELRVGANQLKCLYMVQTLSDRISTFSGQFSFNIKKFQLLALIFKRRFTSSKLLFEWFKVLCNNWECEYLVFYLNVLRNLNSFEFKATAFVWFSC